MQVEALPGCPTEIDIRIDGFGVPHIRAGEQEALWYAQGYIHARDRFFQMELARRTAAGRLSEVFGRESLASDRRMRTWRLAASARRQAALLDGESRAVLESYTAGVNAAIDRFGRWIAPEIWMLGIEPEPWRPESSLEVALLLQLDTSWSMGEEFRRAVQLTRLGRARAAELWGWSPSEARAWIPPGEPRVAPRDPDEAIRGPLSGVGSNSWALAPAKTATGRPLLAADPHLRVGVPNPFALVHLSGPGLQVAGASLPGTPGVLIGHNRHVAWSLVSAMMDDQDLYFLTLDEEGENELIDGSWLPLRTVTEEIRVRWAERPVLLKIRLSEHGPLVRDAGGRALALAWTGFSGDGIVRAVLDLNRSASVADAAAAWNGVIGPSMSLVAADTEGHILHQVVGVVPDRGQGAGRLPAPGADSRWGWRGFLPIQRNPRTLDPEEGYLAAANHDLFAEGDFSMRSRLPGDFASPWRARRIKRVLAARNDWSVAASLRFQSDVVSDRAITLLKLLRDDLVGHGGRAAETLLAWNGRMDANEVGPHVFSRLMIELGAAVRSGESSTNGEWTVGIGSEALLRLLAGGMSDDWWDDPGTAEVETRDSVIDGVLDRLDRLPAFTTWGQAHQVRFRHSLTDLPMVGALLARSFNRGPFSSAGDNVTVAATSWSRQRPYEVAAMPAVRMVFDVGSWDDTVAVMPLGQSGRPWSSHYADQLQLWRSGGAFRLPFSESAVEGATEATMALRPTR
jgi:penicillin amidase